MEFKLTINLDNAAFADDPDELHRIVRTVGAHLYGCGIAAQSGKVRDTNGNTVGEWSIR